MAYHEADPGVCVCVWCVGRASADNVRAHATGPKESRGGLSLVRYGRESSAETVFGVFLPRSLVKLEYVPFLDQNSQ